MNENLETLHALVARIKETNAKIAADIRRIVDQLSGSVTDEQLQALVAELTAIADAADLTDGIVPEPVIEDPLPE